KAPFIWIQHNASYHYAMLEPDSRGLEPGMTSCRDAGYGLALRPQLFELLVKPPEVVLPNGVVRREFCQARHDRLALPKQAARLCLVAGLLMRQRELGKVHREIALPARIAGIGGREALGDAEAVLIGFQRGCEIALRHLHIADLVVAHRDIALPARIAGIGDREALSYAEAVLIGFQRGCEIALRHLHIADLVVAHRDIALPARIAGIGGREALENGKAVLI